MKPKKIATCGQVNTEIRDEKGTVNARRVMKAMRADNYVFGDALGVGGVRPNPK